MAGQNSSQGQQGKSQTEGPARTRPAQTSARKPRTAAEINRFWDFIASQEAESAELILYGDISSYSWWGDEITPEIFNEELKEIGAVKSLVVRINSGGGDVFAANAIYTRLKELGENGTEVTVKIDGWAGSAATIISCAGIRTEIPANGVFMIHNPKSGILGYYEARELAKMAEELEVIKQSIVNCYKLKTGKNDEEIKQLMDSSTWYTGEQAVAEGFCDSIMFSDIEMEVEDAERVIVNHVGMSLEQFESVPKSLLSYANSLNNRQDEVKTGNKEDHSMGLTMEELKTQHKDLYDQVLDEAAQAAAQKAQAAERERIQRIDALTVPGFEDLAEQAKFKDGMSAEQFAVKQAEQMKAQGSSFLDGREKDVQDSGMRGIPQDSREGTGGDTDPFGAIIDQMYPQAR
ncbi:MAG: Clp protease ClpP [Lachnospiraceae bacterium]|nr:Clp protease ClpP [Lachnospiraceae bacterium]MCM1240450.1 Clp protease ClpP [Lachnospiraceae bacterium]